MVKAMHAFRYFDYGHSAEFVQGGKKGGGGGGGGGRPRPVKLWYITETDSLLTSLQSKCGQQNHPEVPAKQVHFGRPRPRSPRPTTARNYTYLRAMARIRCHLTTRTVLTEWQPILTRVVSVSTVRVKYAEMSPQCSKRNRLLHNIWVNRAPCGR